MQLTFRLVNLGCKVNSYELNSIGEYLKSLGYQESFSSSSDVVVINTCSVTATSDKKSRQLIRREIRNNPQAIIIVMGCYSLKNADQVLSFGASIVTGTYKRKMAIDFIPTFLKDRKPINLVSDNVRHLCYEEIFPSSYSENVRAYLKIQDGCDNFCSYCIIPFTRGNSRSREKEEVLKEAKRLVDSGFKEIVLAGVSTGSYGKEFTSYSFSSLVEDIIINNPELKRLRFSSLECTDFTPDFLNLIKKYKVICPHFHISLQSGSDKTLKMMNRPYLSKDYKKVVEQLRKIDPEVAITTDVIVGFASETEEEFKESYNFCKEIAFADIHVFPYSPRVGTKSYLLYKDIDNKTKKKRVDAFLRLKKELSTSYRKKFIGTKREVLIEEFDKENGINKGKTSNYLEVETLSSTSKVGQLILAEIK